jgi:hypothetical protein
LRTLGFSGVGGRGLWSVSPRHLDPRQGHTYPMRGCSSKLVPSSLSGAGLSVALLRCGSAGICTSASVSGSNSSGGASRNSVLRLSLGCLVSFRFCHTAGLTYDMFVWWRRQRRLVDKRWNRVKSWTPFDESELEPQRATRYSLSCGPVPTLSRGEGTSSRNSPHETERIMCVGSVDR